MKALTLINLTGRDVTIEIAGKLGTLHFPRARNRAHVTVQYLRPEGEAGELVATVDPGALSAALRIRWPEWGSHRLMVGDLDTAVEHLPAPRPGVGYLVAGLVAEQVALDGRSLDDLYVVLESARSEDRTMASIVPAARATPAMPVLIAAADRARQLTAARETAMQLARLCGEAVPLGADGRAWYAVPTRQGGALVGRRVDGVIEMYTAKGNTPLEVGIELAETSGHNDPTRTDYCVIVGALASLPPRGPARPGEVRRVVLGTMDPEMAAIVELCNRFNIPTVSHANLDLARDGDLFVECRPAGAHARVVDHHQPGDPGFGISPTGYLLASSLGQVAMALGGLHLLSHDDRVTAACDHCLGPALMGRCPGVTPTDAENWLFGHEPHGGRWVDIDGHTRMVELTAAHRAPVVALAANGPDALDLRGLSLTTAAAWVETFRRELRVFIVDTEVKRPPLGWPKGQPCRRVTMHGMISPEHFASFKMWAELQGARDFFPDADPKNGAARGVAGFYI